MSKKIGNINEMAQMLEETGGFFNEEMLLKKEDFIFPKDETVIKQYLSGYKLIDYYGYADIVYLSKQLRNVLRGHGSFDINHSLELYKFILRLAIITSYMLNMNKIKIEVLLNEPYFRGYYKVEGTKENYARELTPFLVGTSAESILIFNNWRDDTYEYINYLDGTLILPSVVEISDNK